MAVKKTRKKRESVKWDDRFYVRIYQLLVDGLTREDISSQLGVTAQTLAKWIKERPALADVVEKAEAVRGTSSTKGTLEDYVYKLLPAPLKDVWDELVELEEEGNTIRQMDLLKEQPEATLKHLFVHALVSSNFDPSAACRRIGISYKKVQRWSSEDEEFGQLIKEVMWHKKNFFESCLTKLVASGDSAATIFVNKTLNRDRGYDTKVPTEVNVKVTNIIEVDDLEVDVETKRQLLDAIRRRRKEEDNTKLDVIDVPISAVVKRKVD